MKDGVLPDAPIWGDVETFEPTGAAKTAEALLAGFPCQVDAWSCFDQFAATGSWANCALCFRPWSLSFLVLLQGLSQAGAQQGLKDPCSALLKQVLKIWDRCPSMPWAKMRAKMRVSKNQSESGP